MYVCIYVCMSVCMVCVCVYKYNSFLPHNVITTANLHRVFHFFHLLMTTLIFHEIVIIIIIIIIIIVCRDVDVFGARNILVSHFL
jgi:hypothetical protein